MPTSFRVDQFSSETKIIDINHLSTKDAIVENDDESSVDTDEPNLVQRHSSNNVVVRVRDPNLFNTRDKLGDKDLGQKEQSRKVKYRIRISSKLQSDSQTNLSDLKIRLEKKLKMLKQSKCNKCII